MKKLRGLILILVLGLSESALAFAPARPPAPAPVPESLEAIPAVPTSRYPGFPTGSGVEIHDISISDSELSLLQQAGFTWVRTDLAWDYTERERGVYDFSQFENLQARLEARGIRLIFILDYRNPFYDDYQTPCSNSAREGFANWANAAVTTFAGKGIIWEIYNEPNSKVYWEKTPDPAQYTALAEETADVIHQDHPSELVVGPAYLTEFTDYKYLESTFQEGLLKHLDAVTIHPYKFYSGPESVHTDIDTTRDLIQAYEPSGKDLPLFFSEEGFSSYATPLANEQVQARDYSREMLYNISAGIPLTVWYDWKEDVGKSFPVNIEEHFGLVKDQGDALVYRKPAYFAALATNQFLRGYTFARTLQVGGNVFLLEFTNGRKVRYAVWTTDTGRHTYQLPLRIGRYQITGTRGENLNTITADQYGINYTFGDYPVFFTAM